MTDTAPKDAWLQLHELLEEYTQTWEVRRDIDVTAHGTRRGVELTLWYDLPDIPGLPSDGPKRRGYQSTGKRNVSTMRELALAIWAACDFVDAANPDWANRPVALAPIESFIRED